jgi:hypothetical protein
VTKDKEVRMARTSFKKDGICLLRQENLNTREGDATLVQSSIH